METNNTTVSPAASSKEIQHQVVIPDRLLFRIGEVATLLKVKPHVLRYWETEFAGIHPQKSNTGQRVYKRTDVEMLAMIRHLLYFERYSIEGARRRLKELKRGGDLKIFKLSTVAQANPDKIREIKVLVKDLREEVRTPIAKLFSL